MAELMEALDRRMVSCRAAASSWRDAVRLTGELMVAAGCVEARYTSAMRRLIERDGPYLVIAPGIALLHARPDEGVLRAGVAVITLATPVAFGHSTNDPVWLLVGLAATDDRAHVEVLSRVAAVLEDQDAVAALRTAADEDEIFAILTGASAPVLPAGSHQ
jgi:ascorbate PTS system EIIA or EIIAB component